MSGIVRQASQVVRRSVQAGSPAAELALLVAVGLFMGIVAPYRTDHIPGADRYLYWMLCIVGGGTIGIALDRLIGRRLAQGGVRMAAVSVAMAPPVTLLVLATGAWLARQPFSLSAYLQLSWQVFVVCLPLTALRMAAWRQPRTIVETRVVVAPPLPAAEDAFRRRLSARRRSARLIAVEAEDHYLRVHTDAGVELLTLRFADALQELAGVHGFRVHRSWWVAGDAIQTVHWRRGAGQARLVHDLVVPVSRTNAPELKAAGWL